jgi:hypothetical protein
MLQNIPKEKILEVVKEGPTIPAKIVKRVGGDTMLIGAILSTLISSGEITYSNIKIGGSPIYFMKGDEEKLEQFIDHLNEKDRRTFYMIKEKKVMKDSDQDPLIRVSLRAIKDFAKQFEINKEIFWRYYLIEKSEAERFAKELLKETKPVEEIEKPIAKEMPVIEEKITEQPKSIIENKLVEHIHKEKSEKIEKSGKAGKTDFFESIKTFIHNKGLDIVGKEKIKKSEYDLVLKNNDTNEYIFCKAKDKKAINEGDLSTAFVYAHNKKMPCMFLTTGNLTKKAEAMIQKEFKDMVIEKI